MLELQAGSGFGGAARQFYHRHRTPVLSVLLSLVGIATGTASAVAVVQQFDLLQTVLLTASVILAAAVSVVQTRHVALGVLAALSPVPGLVWAAPLSAGSSFGAVPFLAYAFGFAVAALFAQTRIERGLDSKQTDAPWRAAMAAVGFMAVLGFAWFWRTPFADAAMQAVVDSTLAVLSVALLLPVAASLLHFDETFVARANRARERRGRFLERVAMVSVPRWGLSFMGVALVFLALGWFGAAPLIGGTFGLRLASVAVVALGGAIILGDWREGAALGLIGGVVALVCLWVMTKTQPAFAAVGMLQISGLTALLAFAGARRAGECRLSGDTPAEARQHMLEQASGLVFGGIGALAISLPLLVGPGGIVFVVGVAFAGLGGIVFVPAAVTGLETLIPRQHSAESLHRNARKSPAE